MGNELDDAVAELTEAHDFLLDICELAPKEMLKKIDERDPSFIEHIESMKNPPVTVEELWKDFSIWIVSGLADKYHHIWRDVTAAYFGSEAHSRQVQNARLKTALWSEVDRILQSSDF
ncbi:MAG: hypothetical protein HY669_04810 [Chloroflexi bacterium]|nr:hypothetical protein [Chloroflexota bacterium]